MYKVHDFGRGSSLLMTFCT